MQMQRALICALCLFAACTRNPGGPKDPHCVRVDSGHGPAGSTPIQVDTVVTGLEVPWSILFLPSGEWLVTERPGRIRIVRDGKLLPAIAEVPVAREGEGGLLGAALHPSFADNRLFYIYFTTEQGNRVERWRLSPDASRAERERLILDGIPAAKYHDGGRLRVGPDGKLYVGTGDAREPELSQKLSSLAGKILRLEPDGTIPADNPFPGSPVFVLGIRNTQGFDWLDPSTLVVVDHGPSGELGRKGNDELSIATAGANLGWPTIWGCQSGAGLTSPSLSWADATPPGGAAIYRGSAISEWNGNLLIGTLGSRHLHRVVFGEGGREVVRHERYLFGGAGYGRLREVVMGPDGHLYVTTSNCDGRGDCPADKDRILRVRR
jgi:aldose sugar dehydrogenase